MNSCDRILLLNHFNLLMKDEKANPIWRNKKLLVTQDSIFFFPPELTLVNNVAISLFFNESFKITLENIDARIVTEANAKATNMEMTGIPPVPESDEEVVQLIDHKSKSIKLISCRSEIEAESLCKSIKAGRFWSRYFIFCEKSHIKPNIKLLEWLIECISNPIMKILNLQYEDVFDETFNEAYTESIIEFFKNNKLIRGLYLKNFGMDELECAILFQILTTLTGYQIIELGIIESNLGTEGLKILNPAFCHHSYINKLDLSHNIIDDKGLGEISAFISNLPSLMELNLSHNLLKGRIDKLEEFFDIVQNNLAELRINMSENQLEDQMIKILEKTLFNAEEIIITELDISFNKFTNEGIWRITQGYSQSKNKNRFKLKIFPCFLHMTFLKPIFNEKKTNLSLTIERVSLCERKKLPPNKKEWLAEIKQKIRLIRTIRGQSLTVEHLALICDDIDKLVYEFPNKKVDDLRDIIWDLLNRAIETEDFYSVTILQEASKKIGLNLITLEPEFKKIRAKTNAIAKRMIRIINFDLPEADLNREFDEIAIDIFKYDLRGQLIDIFLFIKEKRDDFINKFVLTNYKEEIEEDHAEDKNDPFWFLDSDLEFLKLTSTTLEEFSGYDENLFVHPSNINYYELAKMEEEKIEKTLQNAKEKLEKDPNYYVSNICNRCLFLIADHVFKFYLNVWKFAKGDLKLNCSRIVIQYRNFIKRKEIDSLLDPKPLKPYQNIFITFVFNTPENLFAFQVDNDMNKYIHLKPFEVSNESIRKESNETNYMKPHRGGVALTEFNPATAKNQGILSELAIDKEKMVKSNANNLIKSVLEYTPGPLHSSLRKAKNDFFNPDSISLYQKIQIILDMDDSIDDSLIKQIRELIIKLVGSRTVYNPDNEPDALIDEAYLQLFRFCNRNIHTRQFNNHRLVFKILSIMTFFTPPSEDLEDHVKSWLFSKINDINSETFIKKCLIYLNNHNKNEYFKPDWIPSHIEIRQRLIGENKLTIPFKFCDNSEGEIEISDFALIEDFMNSLYDSDYMKNFNDKYGFWVYEGKNSREEDLAICKNKMVCKEMGNWKDESIFFLVRRRIACSQIPLNFSLLDDIHLDSLFSHIRREYVIKDKFSDFCKPEAIAKNGAIIYIIDQKQKGKDVIAKAELLQKKLKHLIPFSWLSKLLPNQLIQKMLSPLQSNLTSQSIRFLKEEFLNSLKNYPLFYGISYDCQIQDNLTLNNARTDCYLNLNIFGLFFFNNKIKDKPLRVIYYEEIVYIVGTEQEISIFYIEKEKFIEIKLNIFCKNNRAKEFNEDIVSYCILRTREKAKLLYALAFLPEFQTRFQSKSIVFHKKKPINDEDEEEDDELIEEKQKFSLIEKEIQSNELVFLIEKCYAFHFDSPFYDGVTTPTNAIPRSKKTKRKSIKIDEKGESKTESQSIVDKLRKPKTIKDDEEKDKNLSNVDKNEVNNYVESLMKEQLLKKQQTRKTSKEKEAIISESISNSSDSKGTNSNTSQKPISIATMAKIKMAFKVPPPPPPKPKDDTIIKQNDNSMKESKAKVNFDIQKKETEVISNKEKQPIKEIISNKDNSLQKNSNNIEIPKKIEIPKITKDDIKPAIPQKVELKKNEENKITSNSSSSDESVEPIPIKIEEKKVLKPMSIATMAKLKMNFKPPPKKEGEGINIPPPPPPKPDQKLPPPPPPPNQNPVSIPKNDVSINKSIPPPPFNQNNNSIQLNKIKPPIPVPKEKTDNDLTEIKPEEKSLNKKSIKGDEKQKLEKISEIPNSEKITPKNHESNNSNKNENSSNDNTPNSKANMNTSQNMKSDRELKMKNIDLKALLKPPVIKKSLDASKKGSITLEQNKTENKKNSIIKENKEKEIKANENKDNKDFEINSLAKIGGSSDSNSDAQKKLNFSLGNALKSFPKNFAKKKEEKITDEEKFFKLEEEEKARKSKMFTGITVQGKNLSDNSSKFDSVEKNSSNKFDSLEKKSENKFESLEKKSENEKKSDNENKSDNSEKKSDENNDENDRMKFSRRVIKKKTTTKSNISSNSEESNVKLPNFLDENADKKEEKEKDNKQPQSLSEKLKMRAKNLKKNK